MPYTKEQLREYWQANKAILNHKRREKRRLARLAAKEVSHLAGQVSRQSLMVNLKTANPAKVSHGKPNLKMANPQLARLIQEWQTSTNYNCATGCSADKYCSNCWYFTKDKLVDYKGGGV